MTPSRSYRDGSRVFRKLFYAMYRTLYPESLKYNLQIPRGQGPHREDELYEEVKDTRYSGFPTLCVVLITGMPSLFYIGVGKRKGKLDGYFFLPSSLIAILKYQLAIYNQL